MKSFVHIVLLIIYVSTSNSSLYNNLRENVIQILKGSLPDVPRPPREPRFGNVRSDPMLDKKGLRNRVEDDLGEDLGEDFDPFYIPEITRGMVDEDAIETTPKLKPLKRKRKKVRHHRNDLDPSRNEIDNALNLRIANIPYQNEELDKQQKDLKDIEDAQRKAKVLKNAKHFEDQLNAANLPYSKLGNLGKQRYHMDPVLNLLRSHYRRIWPSARRNRNKDKKYTTSEESSSDSSADERAWKEEWKYYWSMKKFEALNSTLPPGDVVNMVAARPWGRQCGDPNQHDMPWGSCMLTMECEPEYRIYRGDYFCGRSEFVCCAIQLTNYDLYQGIDVSFDDKSLSTDSEEKKRQGKSSERKRKKKQKEKKKRQKERIRRKKKIKKNIRKIIKEIRKILDSQYRNGTAQRKRKTSMLKKFVKHLKKQYKKDRNSIKDIHEEQMMKIDAALQERLNQIRDVNEEFMKNATFRNIIINGTITRTGARMLIEAYPELLSYMATRRGAKSSEEDYDVEYGYLYY